MPQVGFLELLRTNRNVRWLWAGAVVSLFGDWFNTLALYRVVQDLSSEGSVLGDGYVALALVFVVKLLPLALAAPLAGVLVDRFNRRTVMIVSDVLRALIVLGFLLVREPGDLWLLYVLAAAQIMVSALFLPAKTAALPNITTDRELLTANALLSATWSIMLALGAAVGGAAVEFLSTDTVFLFDAATYLVSAVFIARTVIPQDRDDVPPGNPIRVAVGKVAEGWRHLYRHPRIGRIALAKATWGVGGGALMLALVLIGGQLVPGKPDLGTGLAYAARGLGTGIGPILARALFRDKTAWPTVLGACVIVCGLGYTAIGLLEWTLVVLVFVLVAHAASGANWVLATTLLQERTEDRFRGRVFSTEWIFLALAETMSLLVASALLEAEALTLRTAVLGLAGVQVVCGIAWLLIVVPRERADAGEAVRR
ncbi:MAG: MFS transporter [Bacteroidota bacterium]